MQKVLFIPIVFFLLTSSVTVGEPLRNILRCKPSENRCKGCEPFGKLIEDHDQWNGSGECYFKSTSMSSIAPDAFNNKTFNKLGFGPDRGEPCGPHIIDIESESFRGLPDLKTLQIRCVKLRGTSSPFKFLTSLTELNLESNGFTELPGELFTGASNLTKLELKRQEFTALSPDSFSTINRGIEKILIEECKFISIEPRSFARLNKLKSLWIYTSSLADLAPHAFEGLDHLKELMLDDNRITALRKDTFHGLPQLAVLVLVRNNISEIESGAFTGLHDLTLLELGSNNLANLRADMFDGLDRLQVLWLNDNGISVLPRDIFCGLRQLMTLGLAENRIREIDSTTFAGLNNIKRLHLGGNRLESLPGGFARDMKKLYSLDFRRNPISNVPANFSQGLGHLSWLGFDYNEKLEIGMNAFSELQLDHFNLSGYQCNVLEADSFNDLSTKEFNLYCNNSTEIKPNVFRGLKAKRIIICGAGNDEFDRSSQDLDDSVKISFPYLCGFE